jgi:excisionase family DNA binding protein
MGVLQRPKPEPKALANALVSADRSEADRAVENCHEWEGDSGSIRSYMAEINLIDINELARRLAIPKGTLYNWVYLRRIPFVKLGRALRFNPEEIERIVRSSSTLEVASRR